MYNKEALSEKLEAILEALERIPRRFAAIASPADFYASDDGVDRMDAICMILIAVGEELKNLDRKTDGRLFSHYPNIQWRGAMGVRDVLAHGYFQVNTGQLFAICKDNIPEMIETIRAMIRDVANGLAS